MCINKKNIKYTINTLRGKEKWIEIRCNSKNMLWDGGS